VTGWHCRGSALTLVVLLALWTTACGEEPSYSVEFAIDGMTCDSCSAAITTALERVDGVDSASADHLAGTAEAVVHGRDVSPDDLAAEIEGLGYTVTAVTRHDTGG
jgi:copper chaperone CopZ